MAMSMQKGPSEVIVPTFNAVMSGKMPFGRVAEQFGLFLVSIEFVGGGVTGSAPAVPVTNETAVAIVAPTTAHRIARIIPHSWSTEIPEWPRTQTTNHVGPAKIGFCPHAGRVNAHPRRRTCAVGGAAPASPCRSACAG